jgi:hypothetical protein
MTNGSKPETQVQKKVNGVIRRALGRTRRRRLVPPTGPTATTLRSVVARLKQSALRSSRPDSSCAGAHVHAHRRRHVRGSDVLSAASARRPVVGENALLTRIPFGAFGRVPRVGAMHSSPRWDIGSRRRIARIRLRGNWPNPWAALATLLAVLALWLLHSCAHATGAFLD